MDSAIIIFNSIGFPAGSGVNPNRRWWGVPLSPWPVVIFNMSTVDLVKFQSRQ